MNLKKLFLCALVYLMSVSVSYATKLPESIEQYLKKEVPETRVRFDGLVTCPDGTIYIPVFPADTNRSQHAKIKQTYPAGKKFAQHPDVILFDTNFALLKVIENRQGRLTITNSNNIPPVVKNGVLPQDLLVPPGLVLPDDLKIILGDLKIPLISSPVNNFFQQQKAAQKNKPAVSTKINPVQPLKNKTFLMTSLDSGEVSIVPTDSTEPKFVLKLSGLPRFVEPVSNDNYVLVATSGKSFIDVADLKQSVLAKKIDISALPSEIVLNSDKSKAYVAASEEEAIFVIDIKTMSLLEKIKIVGYPKHLSLDEKNSMLGYIDRTSGKIFTLTLKEPYLNKKISEMGNVSKLLVFDNKVYLLSRTESLLAVYDCELQEMIFDHDTSIKPVNMLKEGNKLYILSGHGKLQIFNIEDYTMEATINISDKGFIKDILRVPGSNLLLITNIPEKKYYVFDMTKNQVIQTVPTAINVNNLKIMNVSVK